MNRWYQIRRLRMPAMLILAGVLLLLQQWNILSFSKSWPLLLILSGIISIAERAAWAADASQQQTSYPQYPQPWQAPTGQASSGQTPAPSDHETGPNPFGPRS